MQLDHPHIIKLFDVYEDDGDMCYLVMELAEGGELFDRIIAKEYYTEGEAKRVVKVVAKVLAFCHAAGVTHRDLKPENLLYADETADAKIKIADFGFAKLVTPDTNMSTMCGTPGYYAPEIVRKQPVRRSLPRAWLLDRPWEVTYTCVAAHDDSMTTSAISGAWASSRTSCSAASRPSTTRTKSRRCARCVCPRWRCMCWSTDPTDSGGAV